MESSRFTMLTQVNNQLEYGDYVPCHQVTPYADYQSRTNWYGQQLDPGYAFTAYSPLLSSSLVESTDYSFSYGNLPYAIEDNPTTNVTGQVNWGNLSSPNNYPQQPCWNKYENELVDRKPFILPTHSSSSEYEASSMELVSYQANSAFERIDDGDENEYDEEEDTELEDSFGDNKLVIDTSAGSSNIFDNSDPTTGQASTPTEVGLKFCQVCGDKSTGRHYNAFTCEGCKGFFRRSVMKGMSYSCKSNTYECLVDATNRRKCCRACRLRRCLKIGMNPDICLNKVNEESIERTSRANSLENMFNNLNSYYTEFLGPLMLNYADCIDTGPCDPLYISYIHFHFKMTNRLIYFESRLPPFASLSPEVRFMGVKEAAHSLAILFIILHFDMDSFTILWPNGHQVTEEQLKGSVFSSIRFSLFQLCKDLKRLTLDEEDIPLMTLILLNLNFSREQFASSIINRCNTIGANKHLYWNSHMEILHKVHNFTLAIKGALNNYSNNCNRTFNPIVHHHFPYPNQTHY